MALNVTFDGFCSLDDGTLSNLNVQYQAYFYKVNASSTASTWNNVRTVEASGYWNINLGDGDWLTQDGSAGTGDKVIIAFWRGGTRTGTDCSVLDEWGAFEITLDGSSTYTNPTQVKANICPNLIWSFPTDGLAGTAYSSTNGSNDFHTWNWPTSSGTTMGHYQNWNSESIYTVNYVRYTSYDWDDGNQDIDLLGAAIGTHTWYLAGDYTVEIVIEDHCGCTVTGTENIIIKYPPPTPDLICNEAVGNVVDDPDTVVSFNYNGSNPYSRIYNIDWRVNDDTDTVTSGTVSGTILHPNGTGTSWFGHTASPGAFTDPGVHNIEILVYWNDGFDNQTVSYDEDVIQDYFTGPTVDFTQDPDPVPVGSGVVFTNTTTDPETRVGTSVTAAGAEYDWTWDDDGTVDTVTNVPFSYQYNNIPTTDNVDIELCTYWNDGWNDHIACEEKDLAIETTVIVVQNQCYYDLIIYGTSDDGTVSGYQWTISRSTTSGVAGPWEELWQSPVGIDQKEKTICFSEQNYFRIYGEVFGSGNATNDEYILAIDDVCMGEECALVIWNGTGPLDSGGDWNHTNHGSEEEYAKYEGTYGLDATGFTKNKKIVFTNNLEVNVDDYDLLSMYINLQEWEGGSNITVGFEDGNTVIITDYLQTLNVDQWQRVFIPLEDFGLTEPINLEKLTLTSLGTIGLYLDNVEFVVGGTIRGVIDVGRPVMDAEDTDRPVMGAREVDFRPSMSAFPPPGNLI